MPFKAWGGNSWVETLEPHYIKGVTWLCLDVDSEFEPSEIPCVLPLSPRSLMTSDEFGGVVGSIAFLMSLRVIPTEEAMSLYPIYNYSFVFFSTILVTCSVVAVVHHCAQWLRFDANAKGTSAILVSYHLMSSSSSLCTQLNVVITKCIGF